MKGERIDGIDQLHVLLVGCRSAMAFKGKVPGLRRGIQILYTHPPLDGRDGKCLSIGGQTDTPRLVPQGRFAGLQGLSQLARIIDVDVAICHRDNQGVPHTVHGVDLAWHAQTGHPRLADDVPRSDRAVPGAREQDTRLLAACERPDCALVGAEEGDLERIPVNSLDLTTEATRKCRRVMRGEAAVQQCCLKRQAGSEPVCQRVVEIQVLRRDE